MSQTTAQLIGDLVQPLGHADGTEGAPTLSFKDDEDTGLFRPGDNTLGLVTGGSTRLTIDSSGRLLVGTSSHTAVGNGATLQVKGNGSAASSMSLIRTAAGGPEFHFAAGTSGTNIGNNNGLGFLKFLGYHTNGYDEYARIQAYVDGTNGDGDAPGRLIFSTTADSESSPTERMRIDSSGRVRLNGVSGVSTFSARLHTDGNFHLRPIADVIGSGTGVCVDILSNDNGTVNDLALRGATTIFRNASSETLRIDSSGRVGIGTSSPLELLHLKGSAGNSFIRFTDSDGSSDYTIGADDAVGSGGLIFYDREASAYRMVLDSSGRLGIGTTSPGSFDTQADNLVVGTGSGHNGATMYAGTDSWSSIYFADGTTGSARYRGILAYDHSVDAMRLYTGATERARIDSSGRLLVGTSTARTVDGLAAAIQVEGTVGSTSALGAYRNSNDQYGAYLTFGKSRSTSLGGSTVVSANDEIGILTFCGADGTDTNSIAARIGAYVDGTPGSNDMPGRLVFSTTADGASSPTERMRINRQGKITMGQNVTPSGDADGIVLAANGTSSSYQGGSLVNFTGTADNTSSSGTYALRVRQNVDNNGGNSAILRIDHTNPAGGSGGELIQVWSNVSNSTAQKVWVVYNHGDQTINRAAGDGTLITFKQDNTTEGSISVSGSTVSYNGGHLSRWSQLPTGVERAEILRGTVLSNIDEMCEWIKPDTEEILWTQEDLDMYLLNGDEGLPGGAQIGDVKEPATSGVREDNEQLNRMKVSDVEGDRNVAGVFQDWDDEDEVYTNDFYCAMTGDFVIRIAQGVTVERGDLLMSAGDGTAKPQEDDIIRSKTIAKVTSTNVSCTYDDGSYCVPCVLMAC